MFRSPGFSMSEDPKAVTGQIEPFFGVGKIDFRGHDLYNFGLYKVVVQRGCMRSESADFARYTTLYKGCTTRLYIGRGSIRGIW